LYCAIPRNGDTSNALLSNDWQRERFKVPPWYVQRVLAMVSATANNNNNNNHHHHQTTIYKAQ